VKIRYCSLLALLFVGCGCASVTVTRFGGPAHPAASSHIDIYTDPSAIERPYRAIALIIVDNRESAPWGTNQEQPLIQKAVARARSLGADGIIIHPTEHIPPNLPGDGSYNSAPGTVVHASAIVYTR